MSIDGFFKQTAIRQLLLVILFSLFLFNHTQAVSNGDYRSKAAANWNLATTWEVYSAGSWVNASVYPDGSFTGTITIQSGHTPTFNLSTLTLNATLDLYGSLTIGNGNVLTVTSSMILESSGTLTQGNTNSKIVINSGASFKRLGGTMTTTSGFFIVNGTYEHACDLSSNNSLPIATWNTNSTCLISGASTYVPANLTQSFYNFTWNCSGQTGAIDFGNNLAKATNKITNFTVINTGTGSVQLCDQSNNLDFNVLGNIDIQGGKTYLGTNGSGVITVTGNVLISGGILYFNKAGGTGWGNSSAYMQITGNLLVNGGTLNLSSVDVSNVSKGIGVVYLKGNLTLSGSGLITETGVSKGQIVFNGTGTSASPQYFISNNNIIGVVDIIIEAGTVVRLDNNVITGNGAFWLKDNAGIMLGSADGITATSAKGNVQCTGDSIAQCNGIYKSSLGFPVVNIACNSSIRTYGTGADYTYNGTLKQVSGNGLPSQVRNLTLNNGSNCVLTASVSSSGVVTLADGIWITRADGVNLMADDTLTVGTSTSNLGSIVRTATGIYTGHVYGYLARWLATATQPDLWFYVGSMNFYNPAEFKYTVNTNAGGRIVVSFVVGNAGTTGLPITDAGDACQYVAYGYWTSGVKDSYNSSGTFTLSAYGNGTPNVNNYQYIHLFNKTTLGASWSAAGLRGTHVTGSGSNTSPIGSRTGMTAAASFGVYAIVSPTINPLPIELIRFDANTEDQKVKLTWETATEINNDYFTIERSADGYKYVEVGTVKGAGNSSEGLIYSTYDEHPLSGISYYRLRQTDFDGKATTSRPVAVEFKRVLIYPNPVADAMNLLVYLNDATASFEIFDATGKEVLNQTRSLVNGQNQFKIDLSFLSKGVYFLKLETSEGVSYNTFIK